MNRKLLNSVGEPHVEKDYMDEPVRAVESDLREHLYELNGFNQNLSHLWMSLYDSLSSYTSDIPNQLSPYQVDVDSSGEKEKPKLKYQLEEVNTSIKEKIYILNELTNILNRIL